MRKKHLSDIKDIVLNKELLSVPPPPPSLVLLLSLEFWL